MFICLFIDWLHYLFVASCEKMHYETVSVQLSVCLHAVLRSCRTGLNRNGGLVLWHHRKYTPQLILLKEPLVQSLGTWEFKSSLFLCLLPNTPYWLMRIYHFYYLHRIYFRPLPVAQVPFSTSPCHASTADNTFEPLLVTPNENPYFSKAVAHSEPMAVEKTLYKNELISVKSEGLGYYIPAFLIVSWNTPRSWGPTSFILDSILYLLNFRAPIKHKAAQVLRRLHRGFKRTLRRRWTILNQIRNDDYRGHWNPFFLIWRCSYCRAFNGQVGAPLALCSCLGPGR